MNKKGFFFTLLLLLFFGSLALFLFAYTEWYSSSQRAFQDLSQASHVAYVFDDITQDFLQLHDLEEILFSRTGPNVTVRFTGGFNSSVDYNTLLQTYELRLEGNYSKQILQFNISLNSVAFGFSIPEYNMSTKYIGTGGGVNGTYFIYNDGYLFLERINVTLMVRNNTRFIVSSIPSDQNASQTVVQVTIVDSSGTNQILHATRTLDGDKENDPFEARFLANDLVDVRYEQVLAREGVLWFQYDYNISLLALDLVYSDFNRTLHVYFNGTAAIASPINNISLTNTLGVEG